MSNKLPEMPADYSDQKLFDALLAPTEIEIHRHLAVAQEWFPHKMVPWSRGRDYEPDKEWDAREFPITESARAALFLNLLTEDNLPYYFATIDRNAPNNHPFKEWARRWTAEEGRHAIVIRDYLEVTRAVDSKELERARMTQVSLGQTPQPPNLVELLAYVALQELATRISHANTGRKLTDPVGKKIMARVAGDENLHNIFYTNLVRAALAFNPSHVIIALERQIKTFDMPGTGVPNYDKYAGLIAAGGIYSFVHFKEGVLDPTLEDLGVWSVEGLSAEGEASRERLAHHLGRLAHVVKRHKDRQLAALVTE